MTGFSNASNIKIVQTTGQDENAVISQKAMTELLSQVGGDKSYKFVTTLPVSDIDTNTGYLTRATRPTYNYGDYCSNKILYPTDDLPSFADVVSQMTEWFLIYNSYDNNFHLSCTKKLGSGASNFRYLLVSDNYLRVNVSNTTYYYDYIISNGVWIENTSGTARIYDNNKALFEVDNTKKIKIVAIKNNSTFYVDSSTSFTITNKGVASDTTIYANFFSTDGTYRDNDLDNVDESDIFIYDINEYRNSTWVVTGQLDMQTVLDNFALKTYVDTKIDEEIDANLALIIGGISNE
jgi:hypothetical protein